MPVEAHRLVVDTSLWISFLLTESSEKLDRLFRSGGITLLFSDELLDELIEVAQRPKFRKYFSAIDLQELLLHLQTSGELITVASQVQVCRDAKDNFLLNLALDGRATHILTGDGDLLALNPFEGISVLKITDYLTSQ